MILRIEQNTISTSVERSRSSGPFRITHRRTIILLLNPSLLDSWFLRFSLLFMLSIANHRCCLNKKVLLNLSQWLIFWGRIDKSLQGALNKNGERLMNQQVYVCGNMKRCLEQCSLEIAPHRGVKWKLILNRKTKKIQVHLAKCGS